MDLFLGIDVGSVSTNLVLIDDRGDLYLNPLYLRTQGQPVAAIKKGLRMLQEILAPQDRICGVGTTGSARSLAGVLVGADIVKNEITAHAVSALREVPDVRTILEIGGQDSKIIILRDGVVVDFAMNTVCAAGTGSFLDQQAFRLNLSIEEFGRIALEADNPVRIAGRCTVFAESDMIHKQQMGHSLPNIVAGLCEALVRNYLNNVGKGKEIHSPVVFQGGVAASAGIRVAFQKALNMDILVPKHFNVMGAYGAALLSRDWITERGAETRFRGFEVVSCDFRPRSFICKGCPNACEVVEIRQDGAVLARWGDRCGRWGVADEKVEDAALSCSHPLR
ncbi:activator of (R)-2-hydroxyglutaryl-CoA dehydratase HgdC [Thermacetogenium phaeum DSM 12270]|jgi:predicted CoA-substrate-specific enzyme activase|uniref:Activator of (R)-2-hydroxyglutaryl-CoA dehydratase HgdC n=1 Tax=Thermacetogenium phaeum (strain ATCC BAA-254 / DSM 26808 / PB) TaxID=1089553 RepID=K4LIN4_THEPS|nr:acyl-CoA dehydratase activase [Thermacetogenium phaeum]AFV11800.1 activator of (R)-2-hydroxyglutaryl-CoA dehydratase HgdC [Thermacetogenium phaeum DSM 12270]